MRCINTAAFSYLLEWVSRIIKTAPDHWTSGERKAATLQFISSNIKEGFIFYKVQRIMHYLHQVVNYVKSV